MTRLYHEMAERVEFGVLDTLCQYLDCSLADLLEFVPKETAPTDKP